MPYRVSIESLLERLNRKLISEAHLRKNPSDLIEDLNPNQIRKLKRAILEALEGQRQRRDFLKKMEERRGA